MAAPRREPLGDRFPRPCEINQPDARAIADDHLAVTPLERRAGDNPGFAPGAPFVDKRGDRGKPGGAVRVIERVTGAHLGDILRWMQRIAFLKKPAEPPRQRAADRRLAGARHTHHDSDARGLRMLLQGPLQLCSAAAQPARLYRCEGDDCRVSRSITARRRKSACRAGWRRPSAPCLPASVPGRRR